MNHRPIVLTSLLLPLITTGLNAQLDLELADDDESFEFRGGGANDHFGGDSAQTVRTIATGDFNHDGIDDYAIASYDDNSYGTVVLKFGRSSWNQKIYNIANVLDVEINGELSNKISQCIDAGDVNGDGIDDLVIAADQADNGSTSNTGAAYVFFGSGTWSSSLTISDADAVIYGWAASSRLGSSVACGDLNGDGIDDIAIGARSHDASTGRVVVIAGQVTAGWPATIDLATDTPLFDVTGPAVLSGFGGDVWFADVDGDGDDDLFVGAQDQDLPGQEFSGHAGYVYGYMGSGSPDTTADFEAHGVSDAYGFGQRGAGGDINGDGFDDVVILATDAPVPKAAVFTGAATGLTSGAVNVAAHALIEFGSANSNGIPSALAIGDYDDDGIEDLLVGASTASPDGKLFAGSADLFFGRTGWDATGTIRDFCINGDQSGDYVGHNVCLGDINDDGYDDLILNSPYAEESGRRNSGQVYTILGRGYATTALSVSMGGGVAEITVTARSGRTVTIERTTDPQLGWTEIDTFNTELEDDAVSESVADDPARFYRVQP